VLVAAAREDKPKIAALKAKGAEVVVMPNSSGKVELSDMFRELARREINEVHVEAGFRLNGSLVREGCVDELLIYFAPSLLGDKAVGMFQMPELTELAGRRDLRIHDVRKIGEDIRLLARFA
jgi:diaminohydroxyphosphoribosylaminopyrimidine deaminase/5-amino-6-(5-phosphoribosylamino)uracil reductase